MTLAILPALSVLGFTSVGIVPTLAVLVLFLTLRRATNFALARPARETLFTVVSREDKYKVQELHRHDRLSHGDQIGAWTTPNGSISVCAACHSSPRRWPHSGSDQFVAGKTAGAPGTRRRCRIGMIGYQGRAFIMTDAKTTNAAAAIAKGIGFPGFVIGFLLPSLRAGVRRPRLNNGRAT